MILGNKFWSLKGGRGGKGNRALRSNNHQHEKGFAGEEVQIELDMNTIADIGLVGQPNAGKSSFWPVFQDQPQNSTVSIHNPFAKHRSCIF